MIHAFATALRARRRALATLVALAFLPVGAGACLMGVQLREDARTIEKKIAQAREAGAYRCAPAELARAEANLEFLNYELDEGDYQRAAFHHRAALQNVDKAIAGSNPDECADKRVIITDRRDRDGDGVPDDVDQCPDEPEDRDGFQDEDGCPDPDNDGDGVLDVVDRCPNEPGPASNQGCPVADRDKDGIPDAIDKCPDVPGIPENQGCPDVDTDGDGIPDRLDKCPLEPEDKDGFQDDDGCPDPDNDNDGVLDVVDQCPNEPGPASNHGCPVRDRDGDGIPDDVDQCPDVPGPPPKGCPRRVLVVKTDKQIQIKQQINFEPGKDRIKGALSFEILDQVAAVLKSNPDLHIVIEGHTDNVGNAAFNLKLSDARANSVRLQLLERGIESKRVESIGYGKTKPLQSNRTAKGRAANRRVEFNIVQQNKADAAPSDALPAGALPLVPPPPH